MKALTIALALAIASPAPVFAMGGGVPNGTTIYVPDFSLLCPKGKPPSNYCGKKK